MKRITTLNGFKVKRPACMVDGKPFKQTKKKKWPKIYVLDEKEALVYLLRRNK